MSDNTFRISIYNTLYYTLISVPLNIAVGVALALLLNTKIRGQGIYRTLFFIPSLVPAVATTIIWMWLLNPQFGLVNYWLEKIGISGPPWLGDEHWAKPSLILMSLWGVDGPRSSSIWPACRTFPRIITTPPTWTARARRAS